MKITMEPTENAEHHIPHPTVTISIPTDDADIDEVITVIRGILLGWGFHHTTIEEWIPSS